MPDEPEVTSLEDNVTPTEDDIAPDPTVALAARLGGIEALATDLRRTVGRIQSALDKPIPPDNSAREQYTQLLELLGDLTEGIDETALPGDVKQRVRTARAAAARKLEQEALLAQVDQRVARTRAPDVSALTLELEAEIREYGLNPDDFDWANAGTQALATGGPAGAKAYFRQQIREKLTAAPPKRKAPVTPPPAGPVRSTEEQLASVDLTSSGGLDEALRLMKSLGVYS